MQKYELKGSIAKLEEDIDPYATAFGLSASKLAMDLRFIAMSYIVSKAEYEAWPTSGSIMKDIAQAINATDQKIGLRAAGLLDETLAALFGRFPNSNLKFEEAGDGGHLYIPDDLNLLVAAAKKQTAIRSRMAASSTKNLDPCKPEASAFFKVEGTNTGLERFGSNDFEKLREILKDLGKSHPQELRAAMQRAAETLEKALLLEDPSGRNRGVVVGLIPPPDWRMMNEVFDLVWPIESGQISPVNMNHLKMIMAHLMVYIYGPDVEPVTKSRKNKQGLITIASDDDDEHDTGANHLFGAKRLEIVKRYRHQVNTLRTAVKFLEERKMELQQVDYPAPEHIRKRLERFDRRAFYPLLDWRRELDRRLYEGDYRSANDNIRRATGPVFRLPDVPNYLHNHSQAQIALILIRAWHDFGQPKVAWNKGKKMPPRVAPAIVEEKKERKLNPK